MVLAIRTHIMDMKAKRSRSLFLKVLPVIHQRHLLLDVGMACIVPVTNRCVRGKRTEQFIKSIIKWQLIEALTIFKT